MTDKFSDHPLIRHIHLMVRVEGDAVTVQALRDARAVLEHNQSLQAENEQLRRVLALDSAIERIDRIMAMVEQQGQLIRLMAHGKNAEAQ